MIASSAFFVLDAILGWPVSLYDGSWSQWGQLSGDSTKGGQLWSGSPWRTDVPSRSELVVYNYDTTAGPVFYTAATGTAGLNDMSAGGTFTGTANRSYRIQIDATGAPDTFKWSQDGGTTFTPGVAVTGSAQAVGAEGMTVTFAALTGHTLNDRWDFITRRPVELLALDGNTCSSSLSLTGVITVNPALCAPAPPNYLATSANQIEELDTAYRASGGGGGGSIAPGY